MSATAKTNQVSINDRSYSIVPFNMEADRVYTIGEATGSVDIREAFKGGYWFSYRTEGLKAFNLFPESVLSYLSEAEKEGMKVYPLEENYHYLDEEAPILLHIDTDNDIVFLYDSTLNKFALRNFYPISAKDDMKFRYNNKTYRGSEYMEPSRYYE